MQIVTSIKDRIKETEYNNMSISNFLPTKKYSYSFLILLVTCLQWLGGSDLLLSIVICRKLFCSLRKGYGGCCRRSHRLILRRQWSRCRCGRLSWMLCIVNLLMLRNCRIAIFISIISGSGGRDGDGLRRVMMHLRVPHVRLLILVWRDLNQ
ncbi:hypothetical protein TorRG33x02_022020 [Trema orientale]|uniref:Transmembrane protein n=1 Tax=Trema orientale TaxID=63057 RepID=A0A2P5FVU1_TREOI|nr:hypothetical protein TorRG33x02_022020 [Trema orientale]